MSNKEEYQRLINDPATNPALKQLAETKLYNLQMLEKSAEGDKTAPLILALAEAMEKMQPVTLTSAVGTSVSKEEVEKRMMHQIEESLKMKLCDWVIINDDQQLVLPQVIELNEKILATL